jgi:hypothetical protein
MGSVAVALAWTVPGTAAGQQKESIWQKIQKAAQPPGSQSGQQPQRQQLGQKPANGKAQTGNQYYSFARRESWHYDVRAIVE